MWLAIPLAMVTMFGVGMGIERVALRRLAGRPIIMILMMTLGLDIFLRATVLTIWGGSGRPMPLGISDEPLFLGPMLLNRAYAVGAAVALALFGVFVLFFRTRRGVVLRAISDDYTASWSVGISVERGVALSWAMSSVVATTAGVLWGSMQGVDQSLSLLLLKGMTVAVLGGLDSMGGAMLAGLLLGMFEGVASGYLDPLLGGGSRDLVGGRDADPDHHDPAARPVRPPRHREDLTACCSARPESFTPTTPPTGRCFRSPADRWMVVALLLLGLGAPWVVSSLALSSYLLPWLVWTAAALGLNLILGWAGQFHFGYAAIMGIGAYAAVHGARHGIPWEIAVMLGGLTATVIGIVFAFAALRVKGLYLALSTLALQFVMDWVISHVPAISGGTQATLQAPPMHLLGQPSPRRPASITWRWAGA